MPWKDRYTISDEKSLSDSEVAWPDGNRCCFRIVVDLAPACGPAGITPQDLATPDAYYGMHGGLSALTERAAPPRPPGNLRGSGGDGRNPRRHDPRLGGRRPRDRRARLQARGCEPALPRGREGAARTHDGDPDPDRGPAPVGLVLPAAALRQVRRRCRQPSHRRSPDRGGLRLFRQWPGRRRAALLGQRFRQPPRDPDLALLLSLRRPVLPAVPAGRARAWKIPTRLFRNCKAELDAQYKRGRQFAMVLHPHAIGWPNRLHRLEQFLDHAKGLPGLWNATSAQCARHWASTFPPATHLKLEPSIWRDYPGSLS